VIEAIPRASNGASRIATCSIGLRRSTTRWRAFAMRRRAKNRAPSASKATPPTSIPRFCAAHHPRLVSDQTSAHDLIYGYIPSGYSLADVRRLREDDPAKLMRDGLASIGKHVTAMLGFMDRGSVVFDNGNLIRTQAKKGRVERAFEIQIFTEAFLRPLFCRGIGPFAGSRSPTIPKTFARSTTSCSNVSRQPDRDELDRAGAGAVPFQGLPARIAWLGTATARRSRSPSTRCARRQTRGGRRVHARSPRCGRDDAPNIMTENLKDGSDAISDWPLLNR